MFAQIKSYSTIPMNPVFVRNVLIVLLANLVLAVASQAAIHLWWPVPITLQSVAVVLLGLTLGSRRASAAVALYLLEGAFGVPVFAGGLSGFVCLIGPSGGYLWGFLPAAFLAGFLMEKGFSKNIIGIFATAVLADFIIFATGAAHLQSMMGWHKAYLLGVEPFIIPECIKLVCASLLAKTQEFPVNKIFSSLDDLER